jgi:hypothetical protein
MAEGASQIDSIATALFRRVYKRCRDIAHAEFVGQFGPAWLGGKFQWPFLLPGNEQTQINISLSRRIPLTNPQTGTVSLTFPSGASSYAYPSNPVTFPNAYDSAVTPTPVVIPQTNHPDFVAVASSVTTAGFTLTIYYRPNLSTGSVGAPSPDQSSDNATDSTGMRGVGTGSRQDQTAPRTTTAWAIRTRITPRVAITRTPCPTRSISTSPMTTCTT